LSKELVVGWDASEYLAFGKNMFSEYGYESIVRPPIWPIILGLLWRIGFPMPITMKFLAFVIYATIPLITFFSFKDSRKYSGLIIISSPFFFKYSHELLSHILATLFFVLAYSLSGPISGLFAVLSGLTRFTFFLSVPFICWKDKKKWLTSIGAGLGYLIVMWLIKGNPFIQLISASETINAAHYLWFWQKDFWFYLKALVFSPLLFLGLLSASRFTLGFLTSLLYFTLLPHKEYRFFIDMLPFISFSFSEKFKKLWPLVTVMGLFVGLCLPYYTGISEEMFDSIPDGASVVGMNPEVNAYKDVHFYPWFDYIREYNKSAEYCVYSDGAIPCNNDECELKKAEFLNMCKPLTEQFGYIVGITQHPSLELE